MKQSIAKTRDLRKQIAHRHLLEFMARPIERTRELLIFCEPRLKGMKLVVKHPPEMFGDITTNALKIMPRDIYKTDLEFIDSLDLFVPNKRMEVVNGMLNIWFKEEDLISVVKNIVGGSHEN